MHLPIDLRSQSIIQSPLALVLHIIISSTSTQLSLSTAVHDLDPKQVADSNSENHLSINLNAIEPLMVIAKRFMAVLDVIKSSFLSSSSSSSLSSSSITSSATPTIAKKSLHVEIFIHDILLRFETTPSLVFFAGIYDLSVAMSEGGQRINMNCICHLNYDLDGYNRNMLSDLECK